MIGKNIAIIGSGNWGSCIARIIGNNVLKFEAFNKTIQMYVYEEMIDGVELTKIINTKHENVKYLPGYKIPENVVANPDVLETVKEADIIFFVVPHQFIKGICSKIANVIKAECVGISLIKGLDVTKDMKLKLVTETIREFLPNIKLGVMMGANIAREIAEEKFSECTLGCRDKESAELVKELTQTSYFRINIVSDVETVEMCGALKNIVAFGVGILDGLDFGNNTKAAYIRLGLAEMISYCSRFSSQRSSLLTFLQSCGIADLIVTCFGGRNRKVGEAYARKNESIQKLERELLNGQKLQGPEAAIALYNHLVEEKALKDFPILVGVHRICIGELKVFNILDTMAEHPEQKSDYLHLG